MARLVQKFGGTSVGTLERIRHVAAKVINARRQGHQVIVVVSAMSGETDRLIKLAENLTPEPSPREYDVLVSTGEQVSMALLAMALNAAHCPAKSYTAQQVGIQTDDVHTKARILSVKTEHILADLEQGLVVVVAGFQGINATGDITTLGRGGSDTTAVALAVALKAQECQIYTDVEGVYTTDPRLVPDAQLLPQISFEEMLEMSNLGTKVLQMRSVELAYQNNMPIRVLSTFTDGTGTLVTTEDKARQKRLISGIACSREEATIALSGVHPIHMESHLLAAIQEAHIEIDTITQKTMTSETLNVMFSVQRKNFSKTLQIIERISHELGAISVKSNANVAKLSLVGIGIQAYPDVADAMMKALGNAGVDILMTTTSDIKISVIVEETSLEQGVRAIHAAFELNKLPLERQMAFIDS